MASPWKTRSRTRHFKVWVKQSITSLSNSQTVFEDNEQENENHQAEHDDVDNDDAEQNDVFSSLQMINDASSSLTCHNIDQAMNALHSCEKMNDAADFQAFIALEPEHDWILDGHVSFLPEQERSKELLQQLRGPDLNILFGKEESVESSSSIDENGVESDKEAASSSDDDDDEFGEFQTAQEVQPPRQEQTSVASSGSSHVVQETNESSQDISENDDEQDTLGDTNVPREIFHSPLHVERALLYQENHSQEQQWFFHQETMHDVASPEGRFTRRQYIVENNEDSDSDVETTLNLKEYYFSNPEWDATLDALRSMPWKHVPILHDNVDPTIVQDYITQRLSQVDASHALVKSQLQKQACRKTHFLTSGNSIIHEMHHNLSMAIMYVERSQESMARARGSEQDCTGVLGATVLLHEFDKRDQYANLERLLTKIDKVLKKEQELNDCIQSFGTNAAINHELVLERARQLNQTVYEDKDLSRLECLDDSRLRANQVLGVFRNEIKASLCSYIDRLCYNWSICSDSEYERLFRALFAVHGIHLENGQLETSDTVSSSCVNTWSRCILETLLFQAEKCFARSLLDPTDSADSEFDEELITLGYELKQDSRDAVKLISLTHNLVTIRFDFEANCNYLPSVHHRLVALLTEVLHAHHVLTQHHKALKEADKDTSACNDQLDEIELAIRAAKVDIWRRCEQVLAKCLDQYHNFAAKKTLFPKDGNDEGAVWAEDLEGLNDVLRLTQQFLSLGHEFLDADQMDAAHVTRLTDFSSESDLREKLCEAFRKHLRAIHVEAMTSLGASLFNESWRLVPLKVDRRASAAASRVKQNRAQQVQEHLLNAIQSFDVSGAKSKPRYWENELSARTNGDSTVLRTIKSKGNPFLLSLQSAKDESHVSYDHAESRKASRQVAVPSDDVTETGLFSAICELLDNEHALVPAIATEAVNNVLMKWASRLLSVMLKLPLVVDDASKIFRDLCDLYFITSFRLCAGNARNEKIILGIEPPTPIISQEELEQGMRSPRSTLKKESSGFMGFGRRPSNSSLVRSHHRRGSGGSRGSGRGSGSPTIVSRNVGAEVCAPLASESADVLLLRDFIVEGQINLESVVKLAKLEQRLRDPIPQTAIGAEFVVELVHVLKKRQATAWSCLLVAALLNVTRKYAEQTLTYSFLDEMLGVKGSQTTAEDEESVSLLDSLTSYSKLVSRVVPHMVNISSRIACVHAIMGERIAKQIIEVGPGWEEARLNEHSSHYVDETCDRYALLWQSLSSHPSSMPRTVLEVTWKHICEAGFLSLLEGFSRVPYCSTEGRSLMSMDLAAFSDGIDAASIIHRLEADELVGGTPPLVSPERGMRYVDMYIKVFYYPEEDVMKWIVSNYRDYQLNHMLALLTCGADNRGSTDINKLVVSVQALYMDSPRSGEGTAQHQH